MTILQMICIVKEFGVGRPMKTVWISLFRIKPGEKKMIFEGQAPFKIMFKNPHPTETFIHNTLRVSLFRRGPVGDFHPEPFDLSFSTQTANEIPWIRVYSVTGRMWIRSSEARNNQRRGKSETCAVVPQNIKGKNEAPARLGSLSKLHFRVSSCRAQDF